MVLLSLILFGLLLQANFSRAQRCAVMQTSGKEDWRMLENQQWMEVMGYPDFSSGCVVREYFPYNRTLLWTQYRRNGGPILAQKRFPFILGNNVQGMRMDGKFFQQVLDTDNYSWAFLHICHEYDGASKFVLTAIDPWVRVPHEIMRKLQIAMLRGGLNRPVELIHTGCNCESAAHMPPVLTDA